MVLGMVTHAGADLMGLGADYRLHAAARADIVIMDSVDAERLVAGGADKMIVVFEGKANRGGRRWPRGILTG